MLEFCLLLYPLFHLLLWVIKSRKNEIGKACGTYVTGERCIQCFGRKTLREGNRLEDLGIDGRKILK